MGNSSRASAVKAITCITCLLCLLNHLYSKCGVQLSTSVAVACIYCLTGECCWTPLYCAVYVKGNAALLCCNEMCQHYRQYGEHEAAFCASRMQCAREANIDVWVMMC